MWYKPFFWPTTSVSTRPSWSTHLLHDYDPKHISVDHVVGVQIRLFPLCLLWSCRHVNLRSWGWPTVSTRLIRQWHFALWEQTTTKKPCLCCSRGILCFLVHVSIADENPKTDYFSVSDFFFLSPPPPPPLPADCYDACVSSGTCSTIRYTIEGTRTRGAWSVELPWRLSTSMTLGMYTLSSSSQHFFFFF